MSAAVSWTWTATTSTSRDRYCSKSRPRAGGFLHAGLAVRGLKPQHENLLADQVARVERRLAVDEAHREPGRGGRRFAAGGQGEEQGEDDEAGHTTIVPVAIAPRPPSIMSAVNDLERELRKAIRGDVRFDAGSRLLYSTDASMYQMEPVGVVIPRDGDDVPAAIETAARHKVAILPRGGGTSLTGQTVNRAARARLLALHGQGPRGQRRGDVGARAARPGAGQPEPPRPRARPAASARTPRRRTAPPSAACSATTPAARTRSRTASPSSTSSS